EVRPPRRRERLAHQLHRCRPLAVCFAATAPPDGAEAADQPRPPRTLGATEVEATAEAQRPAHRTPTNPKVKAPRALRLSECHSDLRQLGDHEISLRRPT